MLSDNLAYKCRFVNALRPPRGRSRAGAGTRPAPRRTRRRRPSPPSDRPRRPPRRRVKRVEGVAVKIAGAELTTAAGGRISGCVCCSLTVACGMILGAEGTSMRTVSFLTVGLIAPAGGPGAGRSRRAARRTQTGGRSRRGSGRRRRSFRNRGSRRGSGCAGRLGRSQGRTRRAQARRARPSEPGTAGRRTKRRRGRTRRGGSGRRGGRRGHGRRHGGRRRAGSRRSLGQRRPNGGGTRSRRGGYSARAGGRGGRRDGTRSQHRRTRQVGKLGGLFLEAFAHGRGAERRARGQIDADRFLFDRGRTAAFSDSGTRREGDPDGFLFGFALAHGDR